MTEQGPNNRLWEAHLGAVLALGALVTYGAACQAVEKPPTLPRPEPVRDQPLPELPPAVTVEEPVTRPDLTSRQEEQRQEKGGVALLLEPVPFEFAAQTVDTARELASRGHLIGGRRVDVYEVRSEPTFEVQPTQVCFKLRVFNKLDRILRLADSVLTFQVDGESVAVNDPGHSEWVSGIVVPGSERDISLRGPALASLPDRCTVSVVIYDVPVEIDSAGVVQKRENFTWFFRLAPSAESRPHETTYRHESVPWSASDCVACNGSGIRFERCDRCNGTGISPILEDQRCARCEGKGHHPNRPLFCPACQGLGETFQPPR